MIDEYGIIYLYFIVLNTEGPGLSSSASEKVNTSAGRKKSGGALRLLSCFAAFYAAVMFWEIYLYDQINGSLQGFPLWTILFAAAEAMLFSFISGWIRNRVAGRIGSIIVMLVLWVYYTAQLVYHRIFGSLFSVSMITMAGDAIDDFRWALLSMLKQSLTVLAVSLIPVLIFAVCLFIFRADPHYGIKLHGAALVLAAVIWAAAALLLPIGGTDDTSAYSAYHSRLVDADTAAARIGILTNSFIEAKNILLGNAEEPEEEPPISYAAAEDADDTDAMDLDLSPNTLSKIDFRSLAEKTKDNSLKSLCAYFAQEKGTAKNGYTGLFEGHNLIYICGEAFSRLALNEKATPTLWKMAHEGIVLNNYYNSFINWTTNGEFALLTGLWPDVSRDASSSSGNGTFIRSAKHYMPFGLGTMFEQQRGAASRAYHNYEGYYYGRNKSLPNLGFTCKFMNDGMTFSTKWPASDLEMMEQSIPDYINEDCFCVYYMTFSGHGPYNNANVIRNRNIDEVKALLGETKLTSASQSYLACNYELDKAMAYLLRELEKAGKLENTVIVLAGDHYPYNLDYSDRDNLAGHKLDNTFEMYENTCIIWSGMLKDPVYVDEACCNVDIFPTILNLFGMDYDSRLMAGRDIFADTEHFAMLYNKSFITTEVKYNARNGKAVWSEDNTMSEEERKAYIEKYRELANTRYSNSLKMESADFYRFVWDNTEF